MMDLFWQITLIEFLLNVAIFSGAIILYGPVGSLAASISGRHEAGPKIVSGVLFGIATSVALLLPIHLEGGGAVGCTTILLAIAGPLDGWMAVVGATAIPVGVELLPSVSTDQFNHRAIVSLLVSAALGLGFRYALLYMPGKAEKKFQYFHLPFIGIISAAGGLIVMELSQGMSDVPSSILPAMVSNVLAAMGLGTLLLHEKRRSQTEFELRESETNLAAQATELAVARDSADAANRAKSVFLANMSHELRTPLNAILGYAQLLQRDRSLNAWQTNASLTIEQSGEQLLTLITDILDLSKIEAGKIELQLTSVNLSEFMRGICDIIRIKTEEKALEFGYSIAPEVPPSVRIDEKRLRQVLLNLLSNSVKFTDRGRVDIRITLLTQQGEKARLHFEVLDTGTGMTADQLKLIFRPFVQVGDERHRFGGTGLGLSISRQLVGLMGGDIQVKSTVGSGSCFFFDIAALPADPTHAARQLIGQVTGYEGVRRRVLIVDDTDASRHMLADALISLGFDVSLASNGLDALSVASAVSPDLIMMDIRMPVMDGLEAMRRMQQIDDLRKIPVIAVSAGVTDEERADCSKAGVKAFLVKPIDIISLLDQMEKILGLTWIREDKRTIAPPVDIAVQPFIVPDDAQMTLLRQAAMAGNMRAVREKAGQFIALDAKYKPFADKVIELTLGYQSKALLRLVEQQAIGKQVQTVSKL